MAKPTTSRKPARDRILDAASKLFYQEGIQHVGIDRIIAHSGVTKMSLYNHFKSKDDPIEAFLRQRNRRWRHWFETTVNRYGSTPKERLLASSYLNRRSKTNEIFSQLLGFFTDTYRSYTNNSTVYISIVAAF